MTDLETLCFLIDPSVDWTQKNLKHLQSVKVQVDSAARHLVKPALTAGWWPMAVLPSEIVVSESERMEHGRAVVAWMLNHLINYRRNSIAGWRMLDFGCGLGQCVVAAQQHGFTAVGYDVVSAPTWTSSAFTTDLEEVKRRGPYDLILLYDVIDHLSDLETTLRDLHQLFTPATLGLARCHPFCARHGGHLYEAMPSLNKAYAHLLLTPEELTGHRLPAGAVDHHHCLIPADYASLLHNHNFIIINQTNLTHPVEPVVVAFTPIIVKAWAQYKIIDPSIIIPALAVQFIDLCFSIQATG